MSVRKENFLDYLQENADKNLCQPIEPWIQEIIEGNFKNLFDVRTNWTKLK